MRDPNLSNSVLTIVKAFLYSHEQKRILRSIDQITKDNDECWQRFGNQRHYGFIFDGVIYREQTPPVIVRGLRALHPALLTRFEAVLADENKVANDIKTIQQSLAVLISNCQTTQELRDVLPECLVPAFKDSFSIPRVNEEAYLLKPNSRELRQYLEIRPKIEFYASTRLLY